MSLSQAEKFFSFVTDLREIKRDFTAAAKEALMMAVIDQVEMISKAREANVERSLYMVSSVTVLDSTKNSIDMVARLIVGDEKAEPGSLKSNSETCAAWDEVKLELARQFPGASGVHVDFYKKATSLTERWWSLYGYFLNEVFPTLT